MISIGIQRAMSGHCLHLIGTHMQSRPQLYGHVNCLFTMREHVTLCVCIVCMCLIFACMYVSVCTMCVCVCVYHRM